MKSWAYVIIKGSYCHSKSTAHFKSKHTDYLKDKVKSKKYSNFLIQ